MSGKRRSGGPIRQLSLQQPPTTASRRPLRKQQSVDSDRFPGVWSANSSVNADVGLRVTANSIRAGGHFPQENVTTTTTTKTYSGHGSAVRPRPVKLAWTDRRQQENQAVQGSTSNNVEVVAKRCTGQQRPTTSKPQRPIAGNLPAIGGDKDSILYTRQQLAERLRRAWKEREQSRPNLDIFLAHSNIEPTGDEEPSANENHADIQSDIQTPQPIAMIPDSEPTPSHLPQEVPSQNNISMPLSPNITPSYHSQEPVNTKKSNSSSPENKTNSFLFSSTAVGISINLSLQNNADKSLGTHSSGRDTDSAVSNSISELLNSNTIKGNSKQSTQKTYYVTTTSAPKSAVYENKKNFSEVEQQTIQEHPKTEIEKTTKMNFNIFPNSSTVVTLKTRPSTNEERNVNHKNDEENQSPISTNGKFTGIVENKDINKNYFSHPIVKHAIPLTEFPNNVDKNKADSINIVLSSENIGKTIANESWTNSEDHNLNNKITVDVSPQEKGGSTSPSLTSNVENSRTGNEGELEFKTNQEETTEEKINNLRSSVTVNNKENCKLVQPSQSCAVNKIPNTAEIMSATVRRVNFRNSVNKAITGSFLSDVPPMTGTPSASPVTRSTSHLSRALSAPAQRTVPTRSILVQRNKRPPLQSAMSVDIPSDATDGEEGEEGNQTRGERNIKSASARRRLKTAGPRRKSRGRGEESSGDEEEAGTKEKEKNSAASRVGRRGLARGAEIVTMVSLMSDGSDVEADPTDPFLQPAPGAGVAPWLEERNKWKGTQSQREQSTGGVTPAPPRIVCLRKSPKSVSFQQQPPQNVSSSLRSSSAVPSNRRVIPVTPERDSKIQQTSVISTTKDTSLQTPNRQANRSKAATLPDTKNETAVPSAEEQLPQEDLSRQHVQKQDSPATESTEDRVALPPEKTITDTVSPIRASQTPSPKKVSSTIPDVPPEPPSTGLGVMVARILRPEHNSSGDVGEMIPDTQDTEPEFQTPKERECWQLYRRMLEKGVSVSYDTVLRGMLTPTEYRLRRNALLSTC